MIGTRWLHFKTDNSCIIWIDFNNGNFQRNFQRRLFSVFRAWQAWYVLNYGSWCSLNFCPKNKYLHPSVCFEIPWIIFCWFFALKIEETSKRKSISQKRKYFSESFHFMWYICMTAQRMTRPLLLNQFDTTIKKSL